MFSYGVYILNLWLTGLWTVHVKGHEVPWSKLRMFNFREMYTDVNVEHLRRNLWRSHIRKKFPTFWACFPLKQKQYPLRHLITGRMSKNQKYGHIAVSKCRWTLFTRKELMFLVNHLNPPDLYFNNLGSPGPVVFWNTYIT